MFYTCKICKFSSKSKDAFIRHMQTKRHVKNCNTFNKKYPYIKYKDTAAQYAKLIIKDPNFDTDILQPNNTKSPVADIESDDEDEVIVEEHSEILGHCSDDEYESDKSEKEITYSEEEEEEEEENIHNVDISTDDSKYNNNSENLNASQNNKQVENNEDDEIHDFKRIIVYLHNKLEDHDRLFSDYKSQMEADKKEQMRKQNELERIVRMLMIRVNHIECEPPETNKSTQNENKETTSTVNNYIHNHINLNVNDNEINKYTLHDYAKMYASYEKTLEHHQHEVYESLESHLAYIEIPDVDNFLVVHCKNNTWDVKPKHQLNEHKYKGHIMQITQWMDHMKFDGLDHVESLRVYISTPCENDNEFIAGIKEKLNQIHESDFKKRAQQLFPRKYAKKKKEKKEEELKNEVTTQQEIET